MSIKAAEILDCLAESGRAVARSDIQDRTGLASATLTRLLKKLTDAGHVARLERGYYALGEGLRLKSMQAPLRGNPERDVVYILAQSFVPFLRIQLALERHLVDAGFSPVLRTLGKPLAEITEEDMEGLQNGAGVVIVSVMPLPQQLRGFLWQRRIPSVKVGAPEHWEFDSACWDQEQAFFDLTRRLIDEGSGSILYVRNPVGAAAAAFFEHRFRGYQRAMMEAGRQPDSVEVPWVFQERKQVLDMVNSKLDGLPTPVAFVMDRAFRSQGFLGDLLVGDSRAGNKPVNFNGTFGNEDSVLLRMFQSEMHLGVLETWVETCNVAVYSLMRRMECFDLPASMILTRAEVGPLREFQLDDMHEDIESLTG